MRRSAHILAVLALALALGGCSLTASSTGSAGGYTGVKGKIASILNEFASDASSADDSDICRAVFDSRLVAALSKAGGCETVVTKQIKTVSDTTLTITSISVKGTTATASVQTVNDGKKVISSLRLVKKSAGWRIDSLA